MIRTILSVMAFIVVQAGFAHSFWIQPLRGGGYAILHGEPGEGGVVEKGKALDPYAGLKAWDKQGKEASVKREKPRFKVTAEPGGLTAVNEDGPVQDGAKAFQYLRFVEDVKGDFKKDPRLVLQIVPADKGGERFLILWEGKPAEDAWLGVTAPNGWSRWYQANKRGRVKIGTPWAGFYVLTAHWEDKDPGGKGEGAYQYSSHLSSLSFVRP